MFKIGILTWHYYSNVGSNLQSWAMQRALAIFGYDTRFINYRQRHLDGDRFPRGLIKMIIGATPFSPNLDAWRFQRDELRQTRKTYSRKDACEICNTFDAIVCGSDQIWAPNVFDPVYMLDGVSDHVRKISYAASIGLPAIPDKLKKRYKELLTRFDAIGVREEKGRQLLETLGVRATTVLDPTLLFERDEWDKVADYRYATSDCVFCYFLGDPSRYAAALESLTESCGREVVAYCPEGRSASIPNCRVIRRMGPPEFLSWIASSALVLTDSFHGIALSVVYEKEFFAFRRFSADSPINQNSRVENILSKIGLMDRLDPSTISLRQQIDWDDVRSRLQAERKTSWSFLRDALEVRDA